eukprot:95671_1
MEPLIKLRLSLDKLDHHEWIQFKHTWISLLDRNIISSLIYYYFHYHKTENTNYNLNTVLHSVENIIKSREETTRSKSISTIIEQTNSLSLSPDYSQLYRIQLNDLPTDLIGDIATFLDQKTYSHFELLCRQTYISCNNPSTLNTLNLLQCPNIHYNIKHKYSLLQRLYINAMHFTQYMQKYTNQFAFQRLTTLRLSGVISMTVLNQFIQHNNLIHFPSIIHLTCDYFVNIVHHGPGFQVIGDFDLYIFYRFLSRFPILEELRLVQVFTGDSDNNINNDNIIANLLPNLRRLSVMNSKNELVNKIINLHGHKLETLMLLDQDCSLISSLQGFSKLMELSIVAPTVQVINNVLKDTLCLKRIGIGIQHNQNMTNIEFQQLLIQLFKKQCSLEYIGLDILYNDFGLYMDAIKQSLVSIWRIHKHELKIGIHVHFCSENIMKKATFYISQVMYRLRRSNIRNYILFVRFVINDGYPYEDSVIERNKMLKTLNQTYLAYHESGVNPRHECYVIANKNCTIDGYSSGWQPLL